MFGRRDLEVRRPIGLSRRSKRRQARLRAVRRGRADGDTLIELLVAITIIGLTVTAILGTFVVVTQSSVEHRHLSALDLVLKDFSEAAANQIELAQPAAFTPCATLSTTPATSTQQMNYMNSAGAIQTSINYNPPVGYTVSAAVPSSPPGSSNNGVDYLVNNTTWAATGCDASQDWPQMLTVQVNGPQSSFAIMSFVLTDPSITEDYGGTTSTTISPTTTTSFGATTTTSTSTTTSTTTPTTTTTTPQKYIYVAAISSKTNGNTSSNWDTTVTVTVDDQNNQTVGSVAVTGTWSTQVNNFSTNCTTANSGAGKGTCSVSDGITKQMSQPTVTFTVSSLSLTGGYVYWPAANKVVSITVPAP